MFRSIGLILVLSVFAACSQHKEILPDKEYLKQAQEHMADEEYEEASRAYEKLEANHPASPYVVQARMGQAEVYYKQGRYAEAALQYKRFLRYHPRNPLADRVQHQLALSYFEQRLGIDRDQTLTHQALEEFDNLIQQYPDSPLIADAKKKRIICSETLAENQFYIGKFYFKKKAYEASSNRFRQLYLDYPETKMAPNALFYLAESYWELGKKAEAGKLFELYLDEYPEHAYISKAQHRVDLHAK